MDDSTLRELIRDVEAGRLSRRTFVRTMVGLGVTAPLASQMLGAAGVAHAQSPAFTPTKRGGGGSLKALWWQAPAPTLLNPLLAVAQKDWNAAALFYEPLVSFDPEGNMTPVLALEIPSLQNGSVAKDGTSVTWKL